MTFIIVFIEQQDLYRILKTHYRVLQPLYIEFYKRFIESYKRIFEFYNRFIEFYNHFIKFFYPVLRVQFPAGGLGVVFFATGPGGSVKCISFWHSNLPYFIVPWARLHV